MNTVNVAESSKEKRLRLFSHYFNSVVLGRNHIKDNGVCKIISCGINPYNEKNRILAFHGDIASLIQDLLININEKFKLTEIRDNDITIKNPQKHFSCKFFVPLIQPEECLSSCSFNMYKDFKEHSIYDFHKPGTRFSISIIVGYDYQSYLMITDLEEEVFMYGVLVLAEKTAKNFEDEARHATLEITKHYKKKLVHH